MEYSLPARQRAILILVNSLVIAAAGLAGIAKMLCLPNLVVIWEAHIRPDVLAHLIRARYLRLVMTYVILRTVWRGTHMDRMRSRARKE
jgi:hypothetical protein